MATLAGRSPKETFGNLLHIDNTNEGADATLRRVQDGKGDETALELSSNAINVVGEIRRNGTPIKEVPTGGTAGQVLLKTADAYAWGDALPSGGAEHDALVKTAAGYGWAVRARLDAVQQFSKAQGSLPVALTPGANVAIDLSLSNVFTWDISSATTLLNPTNAVAGRSGAIYITATGTPSLAVGAQWLPLGGTAPTLTVGTWLFEYEIITPTMVAFTATKVGA